MLGGGLHRRRAAGDAGASFVHWQRLAGCLEFELCRRGHREMLPCEEFAFGVDVDREWHVRSGYGLGIDMPTVDDVEIDRDRDLLAAEEPSGRQRDARVQHIVREGDGRLVGHTRVFEHERRATDAVA